MDEFDFEDIMRQQRMLLNSVAQESETDLKIKLMSLVNSMTTSKSKKIQKEALMIEAQLEGMSEAEVDRMIDQLKKDHMITEDEDGNIRRA